VHQAASVNRPIAVSDILLDKAIEQFSGQLDGYLEDILGSLSRTYPGEFELLRAIINGRTEEINEYGREAPELIDHLIGYGIIEDRGGDLDVRFEGIRKALERTLSDRTVGAMWAEVSRRRNALEADIRREIFSWSRGILPEIWYDVLSKGLTRKRFEALDTTEPRRLFSKTSSPLYFTDLIALLRDERVLPHIRNQRSSILTAMNTVNEYRKDGHANELLAEEFDRVCEALDELEAEFGAPA
jgi:hypothetical protein